MMIQKLRQQIRNGEFASPTSGAAGDLVQANVVILPKVYAFDFLLFAMRNQKSVPIIEVLENGRTESRYAPGSDIRTDVPKYRIYKDGELVETVLEIKDYWQDDFVTFLIGCSFTFEQAILKAGIPIKHMDEKKNVAMYNTSVQNKRAGIFQGEMVVSMRPFKSKYVEKVSEITGQFPNMHGTPVHIGTPEAIGISDLNTPDYGDAIAVAEDEVPVFWGCGVTPQNAALKAKPSMMISHEPGHMFITDINNKAYLEMTN